MVVSGETWCWKGTLVGVGGVGVGEIGLGVATSGLPFGGPRFLWTTVYVQSRLMAQQFAQRLPLSHLTLRRLQASHARLTKDRETCIVVSDL